MDGSISTLDAVLGLSRPTSISPMAVVSPGAVIGPGVTIGPFCTVGPNVTIEAGATLISHVVVDGRTTIGAGATIYPFATIGLAPQDFKYNGEPTRCVIGAGTMIREHCTIHRGTGHGRGITTVGAGCMLMAVSHVAHDCSIGDGVVISNNVVMGGHVSIDDHAIIGGQSALHQFIRIGRGAMVSGVSGVSADVIPFGHVFGNRAVLTGLNVVGLRRRGFERSRVLKLRRLFRALFHGDGVFAERLDEARASFGDDPLAVEILDFIATPSKRGLLNAGKPVGDQAGADQNTEQAFAA